MRLSNHRRCQLAGHVDRGAAGSLAIPRSFGAARRRRCQFGFLARELSLWRGAGEPWRAVCLPCPQSCSHRRDRAVQARLRPWGRLLRCTSVPHQRPRSADAGRLGAHLRWPTRPWRIVPVLAASRSSRNVVQTSPPLHEARRCESREQLEIDLGDLWEQRGTRPLTLEDFRAIRECEDGGCRCTECRFADEEP